MENRALREKFDIKFLVIFLLVLTKLLFLKEDWALGYYCIQIWDFLEIS